MSEAGSGAGREERPLRILFAQNAQGIGGSENYLLRLLPALRDRGHEVAFAGVHHRGRPGSRAEVERWLDGFRREGIPVHFRETSSYLDPRILWWLNGLSRRGASGGRSFDLLHTHLIYADYWGAMVRWLLNRKLRVVSTVHGYEERIIERYALRPEDVPRNLYWWVFRMTRLGITRTYSCSEGLRDFMERAGIREAREWPVVEHGFDFPAGASKEERRTRHGDPQLLVVGRLIHRKGVHLALEALQRLEAEWPTLCLVVVGDGPDRSQLERLAVQMGLSDRVRFVGFDPDPGAWMRASDLLLVPSYAEGLPLVLFEAMHHRCPAVAFDTIGCRDLMADGVTGRLVAPFSSEALTDACREAFADPDKARGWAAAAQRALEQRHALTNMVDGTEALYRSVTG
jgi:glycosyltransferase involved in cell wall biosynthesis